MIKTEKEKRRYYKFVDLWKLWVTLSKRVKVTTQSQLKSARYSNFKICLIRNILRLIPIHLMPYTVNIDNPFDLSARCSVFFLRLRYEGEFILIRRTAQTEQTTCLKPNGSLQLFDLYNERKPQVLQFRLSVIQVRRSLLAGRLIREYCVTIALLVAAFGLAVQRTFSALTNKSKSQLLRNVFELHQTPEFTRAVPQKPLSRAITIIIIKRPKSTLINQSQT